MGEESGSCLDNRSGGEGHGMSRFVLLTGAAGFLGTHIARDLVKDKSTKIAAMVRGDDLESAERRLKRSWCEWPELISAIGDTIEVVPGDITLDKLGLSSAEYWDLAARITHIIHAAADTAIDGLYEELYSVNVEGTERLLELARAVQQDHGLERFSYISTAYVAGRRTGEVTEESLVHEAGFCSNYERSKYEAELLVREASKSLPVSVFRPGMIVGDSSTGAIKTFNTIYYPLRLYLNSQLRVIPVSPKMRVNMVPVDYVASAVSSLTFNPQAAGVTFHLTSPAGSQPTVRQLISYVRKWAKRELNVTLPLPVFVPLPTERLQGAANIVKRIKPDTERVADNFSKLAGYFNEQRRFSRENTDHLLGKYGLDWRRYLPGLLDFAAQYGFMHRSGRTVHEQVLFRLRSKSRPVRIYDFIDGRSAERKAEDVRNDILRAASALKTYGVKQGDKVAIVGLNSSRYLTLDVAIGLVGAVSVPLYYTSPPADLDSILEASGASLLLIGAPKLIDRLHELKSKLPVISFCREAVPDDKLSRVTNWDTFLASGSARPSNEHAPVDLADIATLRYTSGTTGKPREVAFSHQNMCWIAETVAELPAWQVRNRPLSYLSFLPMNHVVEGMMGTYSPYYVPAPLNITFLEAFPELNQALPVVRPTMLFSVPRFYEKLWEKLEESSAGRRYLNSSGIVRAALRPLVRRGFLKRSGLDKCAQLIVGSAPASDELLLKYRELGIEVHNAFGLTEAPLLTINRVGHNRIGTVGERLPETEISIAADGEILARGPQVAVSRYDSGECSPGQGDWLATGDIGRLTPDGSLIITGRKKELIVTSYGKNIQPQRIEIRLRDIQGVSEAMVVGDNRPYCTALLWTQNTTMDYARIDEAIAAGNSSLSHPEQIRRWAILKNDLSVETGEITPNLKLKRGVVTNKCAGIIDALYGNAALPDCVLHCGGIGED